MCKLPAAVEMFAKRYMMI